MKSLSPYMTSSGMLIDPEVICWNAVVRACENTDDGAGEEDQ